MVSPVHNPDDKNQYWKSIDIIIINQFILRIDINRYRKSIEIEVTETIPYLFTYKAHHFLRENILVRSKSAQNSGCVL